jgi:hypothetical protein
MPVASRRSFLVGLASVLLGSSLVGGTGQPVISGNHHYVSQSNSNSGSIVRSPSNSAVAQSGSSGTSSSPNSRLADTVSWRLSDMDAHDLFQWHHRRAQILDFSPEQARRAVYRAGQDAQGRTVVVIVGSLLAEHLDDLSLERMLSYIVYVIQPLEKLPWTLSTYPVCRSGTE